MHNKNEMFGVISFFCCVAYNLASQQCTMARNVHIALQSRHTQKSPQADFYTNNRINYILGADILK